MLTASSGVFLKVVRLVLGVTELESVMLVSMEYSLALENLKSCVSQIFLSKKKHMEGLLTGIVKDIVAADMGLYTDSRACKVPSTRSYCSSNLLLSRLSFPRSRRPLL